MRNSNSIRICFHVQNIYIHYEIIIHYDNFTRIITIDSKYKTFKLDTNTLLIQIIWLIVQKSLKSIFMAEENS